MKILIQSTIAKSEDDWSADSFLEMTATLNAIDGVEAKFRDRSLPGQPDPELLDLPNSDYDQLWLIGLDAGESLMAGEALAIRAFRRAGGGLMLTRDHDDMGKGFLALGPVGEIHHFHTANPEPDPERQRRDDEKTMSVNWPNYHSGANGEAQPVEIVAAGHPLTESQNGATLKTLPAHPHEGAISVPEALAGAAVEVMRGRSKVTGRPFALTIAVDGERDQDGAPLGRAVCDSSFHHFADYNLDPECGCPSFVEETPSMAIKAEPSALADAAAYVRNIANWLGARPS